MMISVCEKNIEEFMTIETLMLKYQKIANFLGNHKYYFALVLLPFFALFFMTQSHLHQGQLTGKGYTYQGQIKKQRPQGQGEMRFTNGNVYKGNFDAGEFSGQGQLVDNTKHWTYTGAFTKGLPDGKGKMKLSNGKTQSVTFSKGVLVK